MIGAITGAAGSLLGFNPLDMVGRLLGKFNVPEAGGKIDFKELAKRKGLEFARGYVFKEVDSRVTKATPAILKDLEQDGFSFKDGAAIVPEWALKKRPVPLHALTAAISFRLYQDGLFAPIMGKRGSGELADLYRDAHEKNVIAFVSPQVRQDMTLEQLTKLVWGRELEILK